MRRKNAMLSVNVSAYSQSASEALVEESQATSESEAVSESATSEK